MIDGKNFESLGERRKNQETRSRTKTKNEKQGLQIVQAVAAGGRPWGLVPSGLWIEKERAVGWKKSKVDLNCLPPSLLISILTTPFFFHNFLLPFLSAIFLLFLYRWTDSEGMMIDAEALVKRRFSFLLNHEFKEVKQGGGEMQETRGKRGQGEGNKRVSACMGCVFDCLFVVDRGRRKGTQITRVKQPLSLSLLLVFLASSFSFSSLRVLWENSKQRNRTKSCASCENQKTSPPSLSFLFFSFFPFGVSSTLSVAPHTLAILLGSEAEKVNQGWRRVRIGRGKALNTCRHGRPCTKVALSWTKKVAIVHPSREHGIPLAVPCCPIMP